MDRKNYRKVNCCENCVHSFYMDNLYEDRPGICRNYCCNLNLDLFNQEDFDNNLTYPDKICDAWQDYA